MLYLTLVVAVLFYGLLYIFWTTIQPFLGQPTSTLVSWRDLFSSVPDVGILVLLKELIIMTGVYLFFDFIVSFVKSCIRLRRKTDRLSRRQRTVAPSQ